MSCAPDLLLCLPVGTAPSWPVKIVLPEAANQAVDLTSAALVFIVKAAEADADADALLSLTSAAGEIVITDAVTGAAQIDMTAVKSALLTPATSYFWQLRVTLSSGEIRIVRKGKVASEYGIA